MTSDLEGGNRQKAMKRLRVPPLGEKVCTLTTWFIYLPTPKTLREIYSQTCLTMYVTFQGNNQIWLHKTGGHLIQV